MANASDGTAGDREDGRAGGPGTPGPGSPAPGPAAVGPAVDARPGGDPPPPWRAHPTAVVDPGAELGEGSVVWHFCHVMSGARIGRCCTLGQNVFVAGGATLGDGVKVQNNVSIYDGVHLGDDVFCGPSMVFTNVATPRSHVSRRHEFRPTHVDRGATFGANCTVLCGTRIGAYAFVGAGAVVTRDVPPHALVVGVPARVAGWVCRCGVRLPDAEAGAPADLACAECGDTHRWDGARVVPRP